MAVKVTFTLDEQTLSKLASDAHTLHKPKSAVVRDAIRQFTARPDRLSDEERDQMLKALRDFAATPPTRSQAEVDEELAEIRAVRRLPGRLHPVD